MKRRYFYYILILLLLFPSCEERQKYLNDWSITFSPTSSSPFGTKVLCNAISDACPGSDTLRIVELPDFAEARYIHENLLYVTNGKFDVKENMDVIKYRVSYGYSTVIAANDFGPFFSGKSQPFRLEEFIKDIRDGKKDFNLYSDRSRGNYRLPEEMCHSEIEESPSGSDIFHGYQKDVIQSFRGENSYGKKYENYSGPASVTLISIPLLFTNYGVTSYKNMELVIDLLNDAAAENCVKWTACFEKENSKTENLYTSYGKKTYESPIYHEPEHDYEFPESLRNLLIIALFIVFLLFCARRRQRIIPYLPEPTNLSVEFAKQVSLNYYWKKEYTVILQKKYVIFKDILREKTHINLNDLEKWDENIEALEKITGMEGCNLSKFFYRLQHIQKKNISVDKEEMMKKIDKMNLIISKLK